MEGEPADAFYQKEISRNGPVPFEDIAPFVTMEVSGFPELQHFCEVGRIQRGFWGALESEIERCRTLEFEVVDPAVLVATTTTSSPIPGVVPAGTVNSMRTVAQALLEIWTRNGQRRRRTASKSASM